MSTLNDKPWAEFAEQFAKEMLEHDVTEAVVMTRCGKEDRIVTNYYNADYEMRWAFLGHMIANLVMDVIEANKEEVKDILYYNFESEEE